MDDDGELRPVQYEYLDHTADVQLHSWGSTVEEAMEQLIVAFYSYHTSDPTTIERVYSMDIKGKGHDRESMVYNLLEECLYLFETEPHFIGRTARILEYDEKDNEILIRSYGESFDKEKHPCGTAIKAITYSGMQIHDDVEGKAHIYLIVDI